MDLLPNCTERSDDDVDGEEEDDDQSESKSLQLISFPSKTSAPKVDDTLSNDRDLHKPINPVQHVVSFNPTYDQLWALIYGPAHPTPRMASPRACATTSSASSKPPPSTPSSSTSSTTPSTNTAGIYYVGDLDGLQKNDAVSIYNIPQHEQKQRRRQLKQKAEDEEEADVEAENPASEEWLKKNRKSPWAGKQEGLQAELTEEQNKYAEEYAEKEKGGVGGERVEVADKTTFHGKEERQYQERSWSAPSKYAKATNDHCYIPKC